MENSYSVRGIFVLRLLLTSIAISAIFFVAVVRSDYIDGVDTVQTPYIYVDSSCGNDSWDGSNLIFVGDGIGPKATIQAGIDAAADGAVIIIAEGKYKGQGNENLNLRNKGLTIIGGPQEVASEVPCLSLAVPKNPALVSDSNSTSSVFLVLTASDASWEDFAFLAAVPASCMINSGKPCVITLDVDASINDEQQDFLNRYSPGQAYVVGNKLTDSWMTSIECDSVETACRALAETFWSVSQRVVICDGQDYKSALSASALAGRLKVPLLYSESGELSPELMSLLLNMGTDEVITVGSVMGVPEQLRAVGLNVTELLDAKEVMQWMVTDGLSVDYIAMANPNDRTNSLVPKVSLAAPVLAATRGGAVATFEFDVQWKTPFYKRTETYNQPDGTISCRRRVDVYQLSSTVPPYTEGFAPDLYPVNLQYGKGTLPVAFLSTRTFYLAASTPDSAKFDRVLIDINENDFIDAEEVFEASDVFVIGSRHYSVLSIKGDGRWPVTGSYFECGFENWWLGTLKVNGKDYNYAVTCLGVGSSMFGLYDSIFVDIDDNNSYDGPGEGPFISGDDIELAGKRYTVTVCFEGTKTAGDIKLTYPCANEIRESLKDYFAAVGSIPQYLCIVGYLDAIPSGLVGAHPYSDVEDIPTDLLLANVDEDVFADVCIGRIIGENYHYATLLAARSVVYEDLVDPCWSERMLSIAGEDLQVGIIKFATNSLENIGFDQPMEVFNGAPFINDQMADRSVIIHFNHAGQTGWSGGPGRYFTTLLAPCIAESGGCLSAALDLTKTCNTIATRFLRKGAVAYIGNSRQASNPIIQHRSQFWSGIASGLTLGQAHKRAHNAKLCRHMEEESLGSGYEHIAAYEATLYGDPALAIYIPAPPEVTPANCQAEPNSLIINGPEQWRYDILPVDFHAYTGYGVSLDDFMERARYFAEYRTPLKVNSISQVTAVSGSLGWNGKWFIDEHQDGTQSVYWLTRLIDFNTNTGKINYSIDTLEYSINFLSDIE